MTWLHSYWSQAGGNIVAMPLQAVITGAAAWVLRSPLARLLGGQAAKDAAAALRIAADLYQHHTGQAHPDAPARGPEGEGK